MERKCIPLQKSCKIRIFVQNWLPHSHKMSHQYLNHRLFIFPSSQDPSSGRQRSSVITKSNGNFCIHVLVRKPRDTEVIFDTWVYINMTTQMRLSQNTSIDKCLVIFIIAGLQEKDFGSCCGSINFIYWSCLFASFCLQIRAAIQEEASIWVRKKRYVPEFQWLSCYNGNGF